MASDSERFFERYAQALNSGDAGELSDFHLLPTIFMTDDSKKVCSLRPELVAYNQALLNSLHKAGVEKHIPQVNQAMRLSDSVLFCNVRWQCLDSAGSAFFSSTCSYTLQHNAENVLKIIVVVLDGDESFLTSLGEIN